MLSADRVAWASGLGRGVARRERWTPQDDDTLRALVGTCGVLQIAEKIGRSYVSTANRLRRLGYRVRADVQTLIGLPLPDVAKRVGVPDFQIYRDARAGVIPHMVRVDRKMRVVRWPGIEAYRRFIEQRMRRRERVLARIKEPTITKTEAMAVLNLSEIQLTRYLKGGVIKGWKVPAKWTDARRSRWDWLVSKADAERVAAKRAAGTLKLRKRGYRKIVERDLEYIRNMRRERRLGTRQVRITRKCVLPGHMTVAQVAQAIDLGTQQVYAHIKLGRLPVVRVPVGLRPFVCITPEAFEAYREWCARPVKATGPVVNHRKAREAVAAKGLLTISEAARLYGIKPGTIRMACRTLRLPHRHIGGLFAIDRGDMELYAKLVKPRRSKHETR